ncbi:MAG: zinc ribbon domain-containing protein [Candidatus Sumerlaeia bacterium]|nr:zinc ribbon domain-containing protein [Candidatus Sumerlaeia bacterium]
MPIYEYLCPANNTTVEVYHGISQKFTTWGALCAHAQLSVGNTPEDSPVERLIYPSQFSTPQTNADLKNLGFTKLVKRDDGVYENVTATHKEKRYMQRGDASSVPDIKSKISD